jgi:hypothetical protein
MSNLRTKKLTALEILEVEEIPYAIVCQKFESRNKNFDQVGQDWYIIIYSDKQIKPLRSKMLEGYKNVKHIDMNEDDLNYYRNNKINFYLDFKNQEIEIYCKIGHSFNQYFQSKKQQL